MGRRFGFAPFFMVVLMSPHVWYLALFGLGALCGWAVVCGLKG